MSAVSGRVQGTVSQEFEPVREAFAAVLRERPDHAAQVAVFADGVPVADLWGGPDLAGDALLGVFSSSKGAAALVAALLLQDGILDADREVSYYWPEFAAEGKDTVKLWELLSHRAGAVGTEAGFSLEELADDRTVAERVAAHRPYWRPGSAFGYHGVTLGALLGEVVLRTTGRSLQECFEQQFQRPLGLEFFLGLPERYEPRVAGILPMRPTPEQRRQWEAALPVPDSLGAIAANLHHPGVPALEELPNHRVIRAAGPASFGGVGSARGLARMYAAAVSGVDGRPPLLAGETVARIAQPHSAGHDLVLHMHRVYGLGFMVDLPSQGAGAFGHDGAGGSMGFADPRSGLAFGYVRRRFPYPGGAGPEAARLAAVARRCALAARGATPAPGTD
ncbi:serine hydrolase [Streptomyces sp. ACA25]|uniref:serine hydrolase domain-containing protein n=1 Tax=Streptomyces sp. ACA25 TaxID=3022596 RepID=UPI0023076ABD|nr:serine hydrolase domain-containing protein [Streptomyces sp. ACA25]MDB1088463.1 serine hydrolase [Streptomyces sp. ACA25]